MSFSEYNPKWMAFAIYWVGFSLREHNDNFASNLIPHSMDFRPDFYEKALILFREYIQDFPMQNPLQSRPVKQIYQDLLQKVIVKPRIENHMDFINVDFRPIWKACRSQFLDPELKTFRFKLAHRVLALKVNLSRLGVLNNQRNVTHNCTFCRNNNAPETFDHFFLACPQITEIWDFIQPILYKLCNHRLKFDKETVFLCQLPRVMSSILKDICNYIITLAMYSVWKIRNSVIHGEYGPGREAPPGSTLDLFCKSLKFRIRADFSRYHAYQFSDLWAKNEAFCKFDGDSLDFLF